jgi:sugar-specific transcriptional regulator TrmB
MALLKLKEALPSTVAQVSGVKRPTAYIVLERLLKKGFVSRVKRGVLLYYRALSPYVLVDDQYRRYAALEKALPELAMLDKSYTSTPQMTIYEGEEGIIKMMEDTLRTSTEILCWANVSLAVGTILKNYYPSYVETKVKKGIWLRGIFSYDKTALAFKKRGVEELREVYLIPKAKFPFDNEINIYDDKLSITSHKDKVGVIVQNRHIANTQRSIFNFAFEYAKIVEKDVLTEEDKRYL